MKTILLHIHDDLGAESRLQAALDTARAHDAHIRCIQMTPVPDMLAADIYGGAGYAPSIVAELREHDEAYRAKMEARLAREDVAWDWQQADGDSLGGLIGASVLADLIVFTLPEGGRTGVDDPLAIVPDLALAARAPVLAVPPTVKTFAATGRALVAWDGSAEAGAALRAAVPLLKRASTVDVVTIEEADKAHFPAGAAPEYLARHGIGAQWHSWPRKGRAIDVALAEAIDHLAADWVVMGAFGHSRLREFVFGGVTRAMLRGAQVPLLLAH